MNKQTLPRYISHKEVGALEIKSVDFVPVGLQLTFVDDRFIPMILDPKVTARYQPVAGDFYVVYDDGYESISPRKAFVEGYKVK